MRLFLDTSAPPVSSCRIDLPANQWQPHHVKAKKEQVQKPTAGTVVSQKYRARCNQLSDSEREKLGDEFLKLYYARPVPAARRR
jgi:hypothetical protein